jgi:sulfate/thiosulfate-binding protein
MANPDQLCGLYGGRLVKKRMPIGLALTAALAALVAGGCGGSSDTAGGEDAAAADGGGTELQLVAYAVPKVGFDKVIPLFQATPEGKDVSFSQSYGASGDQSRKVEAGLQTDVVNFSVEPDITRLVDAGLVDKDWNADDHRGIPFGSVVTIVTRKGNPKHVKTWDDLLQPGLEVVTPNPFSSGSAKWNLLAPYAEKSEGGKNPQAGLDYLGKLVGDHVKVQPKSGREATETFLQGTGDVLLSYENEALFAERQGEDVEHVTPPVTFKIENPVALLNDSEHPEEAKAFVDFLYTPEAQKGWAEAGFRPVDESVAAEFRSDFPEPEKLWTIADLGGWSHVDDELFDEDNGSIAKIYEQATG